MSSWYKRNKVFALLSGSMIVSSVALSGGAYAYINNIEDANNLTQGDVYKLTDVKESDSKLVRSLKSSAFDAWLHDANVKPVERLKHFQDLFDKIQNGNIPLSEIDSVIGDIKNEVKNVKDYEIDELYISYYQAKLPTMLKQAQDKFNNSNIDNFNPSDDVYLDLIKIMNKIYDQKNMLSVSRSDSFNSSMELFKEINRNAQEINKIVEYMSKYDKMDDIIEEPKTRLGKQLKNKVAMINDYTKSKWTRKEFDKNWKSVKSEIHQYEEVIKNSVKMPNLEGKTVAEAIKIASKNGIYVNVASAAPAPQYTDGSFVPNLQESVAWDGDESDEILMQNAKDYQYILKGQTLVLFAQNKPIDKPKPPKPKKVEPKTEEVEEKEEKSDDSKQKEAEKAKQEAKEREDEARKAREKAEQERKRAQEEKAKEEALKKAQEEREKAQMESQNTTERPTQQLPSNEKPSTESGES